MHARVEQALALALAYMRYVQEKDPQLHVEADGSPSAMREIKGLLSGEGKK